MAASSSPSVTASSPSSISSPTTDTSTSATPTTTSTSTTTTNTSTSTSQTSSQTSTSTSTVSASTQSSTTSTTTTSTPSPTQFLTTSGNTLETITVTPTVTPTSTSQNASTSNSFFDNKGAVAGVFTVVGLIVVALIVALVVNAIRRHRAQKFDRDVAEAAAEAAASSQSPFEDYSYSNTGGNNGGGGGGGGGPGYGYSDNSHGTYNLPPLSPRDTYGMSEMSQYDPYAAGAASLAAAAVGRSRSRKESESGAPGIAGVGAGTLAREPSKRAPYHAFAGPAPQPQDLQRGNGTLRSIRGTNQDVLEAAGLAGTGLNTGAYVTRRTSETTQNTHLSGRSQFGSMSGHPSTLQPGYPVESYYPQRNDSHSPDPFAAGYPPIPAISQPLPNPHDVALPSSPPPGQQSDHTEEYTESGSPTALRSEEQRMSYQDDTDYSQGNRVLRVANE